MLELEFGIMNNDQRISSHVALTLLPSLPAIQASNVRNMDEEWKNSSTSTFTTQITPE
jgi:hypothetical protein